MKKSQIIGAAVIAGSLLVAGGVVAGVALGGNADATAPTPSVAPLEKSESKCGLVGTRGDTVTATAQWENVAGVMLPVSTTDGPGIRDAAGSWSCFSHTRSGAVLAGTIIPIRAEGIAEDWQSVIREQTMPGPGQTIKLQSTPQPAPEPVTVRGFSIAAYSDERATIAYYLKTPSVDASCTADLRWFEGDWRLQLGDDGSSLSGCTPGVPASFTPWGP